MHFVCSICKPPAKEGIIFILYVLLSFENNKNPPNSQILHYLENVEEEGGGKSSYNYTKHSVAKLYIRISYISFVHLRHKFSW